MLSMDQSKTFAVDYYQRLLKDAPLCIDNGRWCDQDGHVSNSGRIRILQIARKKWIYELKYSQDKTSNR